VRLVTNTYKPFIFNNIAMHKAKLGVGVYLLDNAPRDGGSGAAQRVLFDGERGRLPGGAVKQKLGAPL
jgi:hypothetical protein